jgi:hypothetical protein
MDFRDRRLTVPLALTVLRSGIPNNIPGRTLEIGEGGMGVVPASQLLVGEYVRVEFLVPHMSLAGAGDGGGALSA